MDRLWDLGKYYVSMDDSVVISLQNHGVVDESSGETFLVTWIGDDVAPEKMYESEISNSLSTYSRALQLTFMTMASHGGGLLNSVQQEGRISVFHAEEFQSGRLTDNLDSDGGEVCESYTCVVAPPSEEQHPYCEGGACTPTGTDPDATGEIVYYLLGAFFHQAFYENDNAPVSDPVIRADRNHNGLVSFYEAWLYAKEHNSWIEENYPERSDVWIDPVFDDDGLNPSSSPSGLDGLIGTRVYA